MSYLHFRSSGIPSSDGWWFNVESKPKEMYEIHSMVSQTTPLPAQSLGLGSNINHHPSDDRIPDDRK